MAVFFLAIGAACCLGLGFVLQQHAAQRAPRSDLLHWRLLLDLLKVPEWLAGLTAMVIGLVLSAWALGLGEVSWWSRCSPPISSSRWRWPAC